MGDSYNTRLGLFPKQRLIIFRTQTVDFEQYLSRLFLYAEMDRLHKLE